MVWLQDSLSQPTASLDLMCDHRLVTYRSTDLFQLKYTVGIQGYIRFRYTTQRLDNSVQYVVVRTHTTSVAAICRHTVQAQHQ